MSSTTLIPVSEFTRVNEADALEDTARLALIGDMCRVNALNAVKRAGSGHLGSSFSSMEIMVTLYYQIMNVRELGPEHPDRDVFLSSKGHDVPAQYSILNSLGIIPSEQLLKLRRLGGLEGHPSVKHPGIEANTGSLGMGISKGRGIALGKRMQGRKGDVYVLTGDGELQEGQIWEALQTTAHQRIGITVIVDDNKLQSDKLVSEIIDLGDLPTKFRSFGWHVERCDGHDIPTLIEILNRFRGMGDQPRVLIADTIKGRGVSFMEHPVALEAGGGLYRWHAGAPSDEAYQRAQAELLQRIGERLEEHGLEPLEVESVPVEAKGPSRVSDEYVVEAFGKRLVEIAREHEEIVVLDGDLAADCRVREFEETYPDRFVENGIAEQDMVSMAGGLALQGLLPVVNSFGTFLAARANEQIYNNCSEGSKIIYVCHLAGIIPAGPGKSHQSVRDISLFRALPNCVILEPCNAAETEQVVDYCVKEASQSCMVRLAIGPSPRLIELPEGYRLTQGRGVVLREGRGLIAFVAGPVLLHEVLAAAEALEAAGVGLRVVNMPWLNRVDQEWLLEAVDQYRSVFTIENHSPEGGLGDTVLSALVRSDGPRDRQFFRIGVDGYPACGAPQEVLQHHGLDAASLADRILAVARTSGVTKADRVAFSGAETIEADTPIG